MGIFHSPKFRITCIIRNNYNQKTEAALLSFCQISGSFCGCFSVCARPLLRRWTYYQYVQVFDFCLRWLFWCVTGHVIRCYRFFSFGDAMLILQAAVLCRSMHKWLRNKCVPQLCIPPRFRSAPHPRRSSQSTAPPTLPDNPHPPAA